MYLVYEVYNRLQKVILSIEISDVVICTEVFTCNVIFRTII